MVRYFMSPCDTFCGRHLCQLLTSQGGEVHGTLNVDVEELPANVASVVDSDSFEDIMGAVLDCHVIILDVLERPDETLKIIRELRTVEFMGNKTLIVLSSFMSWSATIKDPDNPEEVFTEEMSVQRKTTPAYQHVLDIEKQVHKRPKRENLTSHVIHSGLLYGEGENWLHSWFKQAWMQQPPSLPVFGKGDNVIPMIHVKDLCQCVYYVVQDKPARSYILAVDDGNCTFRDIVSTISSTLSTGEVHQESDFSLVPRAEFFIQDLRFEAGTVKEFDFEWVSQEGFVENIDRIMLEYRQVRNLMPVRIVVSGAPATGKTLISQAVAHHYKLPHLSTKNVIAEFLGQREWLELKEKEIEEEERAREAREARIAELEEAGEDVPEELSDPEGVLSEEEIEARQQKMETVRELLESVEELKEEGTGRFTNDGLCKIFRWKLDQKVCRNQGYVLDSFPKTVPQARLLFSAEGEESEEAEPEAERLPEYLLHLHADKEVLINRILRKPEAEVAGTHDTEEGFERRYAMYVENSRPESSVETFFEENEVVCRTVESEEDAVDAILKVVQTDVGPPRNYGLTPEELCAIEEQERQRLRDQEEQAELDRQRQEDKQKEERQRMLLRQQEEEAQLAEVKRQEREIMEARSAPLRQYLMENVMPSLTKGLVNACKLRPEDPIDYLAEYLFHSASNMQMPGEQH